MPTPYFAPGMGPFGLENGLTMTVFAPADTNTTTNKIAATAPLMLPAVNTNNAIRPADAALPDLIAIEQATVPNQAVGVRVIKYQYAEQIAYTGALPGSGTRWSVQADGAGAWKIVAAGGQGYVLSAAGGVALVLF